MGDRLGIPGAVDFCLLFSFFIIYIFIIIIKLFLFSFFLFDSILFLLFLYKARLFYYLVLGRFLTKAWVGGGNKNKNKMAKNTQSE